MRVNALSFFPFFFFHPEFDEYDTSRDANKIIQTPRNAIALRDQKKKKRLKQLLFVLVKDPVGNS